MKYLPYFLILISFQILSCGGNQNQGVSRNAESVESQQFTKRKLDNGITLVQVVNHWWTVSNNHMETPDSYCVDGSSCLENGRLYTWQAAKGGCEKLGKAFRLPTLSDAIQLAEEIGGYHDWLSEKDVADPIEGESLFPGGKLTVSNQL